MQGLWKTFRGAALFVALASLAACDNKLPTANGPDMLPPGLDPTTLQIVIPASQFLLADTVYGGYADVDDATYLLVANSFGGALEAHALSHLTGFPDSVAYTRDGSLHTDGEFTYVGGRILAIIDSISTAPRGPINLQLWQLGQPWDSATVSWDTADARAGSAAAWHTPGGTLASLVSETTWIPGDTTINDTIMWTVDSATVNRMIDEDFPGLAIVSATTNSRIQMSGLLLEADVRPASDPDTVLTRDVSTGPQTFIFSPALPDSAGIYRVSGLSGQRTVLRIRPNVEVPTCADPAATDCPMVPLDEVSLNKATLLLDPITVPQGFGPIGTFRLSLRRVIQPELGRNAPLGTIVATDTIQASAFDESLGQPIGIDLGGALVVAQISSDTADVVVALLASGETPEFGTLWFTGVPRLQLLYTLPLHPKLP